MIVADASVLISALLRDGPARRVVADEQVEVPSHVDAEVAQGLRKQVRLGRVTSDEGWRQLDTYRWLAVTRHDIFALFDRIWELRDNLTAYDAAYVALAEATDCTLVTGDARLSRAPGVRCPVTVLPG